MGLISIVGILPAEAEMEAGAELSELIKRLRIKPCWVAGPKWLKEALSWGFGYL
jgi:hypothetical protein